MDLKRMRVEYDAPPLRRSELRGDPVEQFKEWLREAAEGGELEPNAMTLATVGLEGGVSARVVLLKGVERGSFVFFTNYESCKGRELAIDNRVALTFAWYRLGRQVRVRGVARKLSRGASRAYFAGRPRRSQIAAWASRQSEVIGSREELEARYKECEARFAGKEVPCPPWWGGYRVIPEEIEFWQGRRDRLHDRFVYRRGERGKWVIVRLAP
ncbi:MAG: pyridoxamine 5'-phosphate oxidase [bacterium]|nr:pyridoxamine 5'-phosphate oxidase [bacterium]